MQKRILKVLSATLAALTMASMLAGCTSKSSASPSAASGEKTKIAVWTANRSDAQYVQSQIANYNKTNKDNIEIDYSIYSDNYQQSLELAYATDAAPDVFFDTGDFFVKYVGKGYFQPLNKYLTSSYKERFGSNGFINGINVINGKTYSLPALCSTPRLVYNADIFKEVGISAPPKSLTELVSDSKLISEKLKSQNVYGFAANLKTPSQAISRSIVQMLELSGYPIKEGYNFKEGKYDFTPYKPILQAYNSIFMSDAAFPGCESLDIDPLRAQFANGKIAMYISWTHSEPAVYQNQYKTTANWNMAPLPTIDGTVKGSQDIMLADKWLYINGKSKKADKAWKVMEFFYSDNYLKGYYENGLGIVSVPSVLKVATDPPTVQKIPELKLGTTDQIWPNTPTGVTPEGTDYYQVFTSLIFSKNPNYDSQLAGLNTRYNNGLNDAIGNNSTKKVQYKSFDAAKPSKVLQ